MKKFAEEFDIEKLYRDSKQLSMTSLDALCGNCPIIRAQSLNYWFAYYGNKEFDYMKVALLASCRIDQMMPPNDELDLEDLTTALKVISDSTRYQVLVDDQAPCQEQGHCRTPGYYRGATVSFHTQKLINSDLLLFNAKA